MNKAVSNNAGHTHGGAPPLVSIMIICYNQEAYIEAAVLSCMRQTYTNIEIIVADDASTDATVALVAQLAADDERVKLHPALRNRGITGNCQFALEQCRGKYIAILGGDDFLYPEKIAIQVECMEADQEIALSFTQCHIIHGEDLTPVRITADTPRNDISDGYQLAGNFGVEIPGPAPMVRASMVPQAGFRAIAPVASDWLFFIETSRGHKCKLIKTPLAAYRMHGNNIGKKRYNYLGDYCSSYEFIKTEYANDARLVRLAGGALRRYLLGSFYASMIDADRQVSQHIASVYRQSLGGIVVYSLLRLTAKLDLASVLIKLKPLLKKIV